MMKKSEKFEIWKIMWTTSYFPRIALIFFESSRTEDMTILRKSKNSKNPSRYSEKIWKIRALEKSQIFSFFSLRYVRVLLKNQRNFEKWWRKRWEFKKSGVDLDVASAPPPIKKIGWSNMTAFSNTNFCLNHFWIWSIVWVLSLCNTLRASPCIYEYNL